MQCSVLKTDNAGSITLIIFKINRFEFTSICKTKYEERFKTVVRD